MDHPNHFHFPQDLAYKLDDSFSDNYPATAATVPSAQSVTEPIVTVLSTPTDSVLNGSDSSQKFDPYEDKQKLGVVDF